MVAKTLAVIGLFGMGVMAAAGAWLAPGAQAATGINQTVNFQGKVVNSDGTNVPNGTYNMEFKIYTDGAGTTAGDTGGTLQWTEDWLAHASHGVSVTDGIFQINLGSITGLPTAIFNSDTVWLSMNLGNTSSSCTTFGGCSGDGEMLPMIRFTASPYSFNSLELGGITAAGFAQLSPASAQTGSLNVTGSVQAATSLQAPLVDAATAVELDVGTGTASAVKIGRTTTPFTIQGNSSSTFTATSGANTTTVAFAAPTANQTLTFAAESGAQTICTTTAATCSATYQVAGNYLAKNAADTSSFAVTAANYLYGFTNSSSAIASGVLKLDNGSNTGDGLLVTASGNAAAGNALIVANSTGTSGNVIDLQKSAVSQFSVDVNGNVTQNGGTSTTDTVNGQTISAAANFTGTVAAATSVIAPLHQTADSAVGDTTALVVRSGNESAGSAHTSGTVTIQSGNGSGTNSSSGNVSIDSGTKTGSGTTGSVSIGTGNTAQVNIGRSSTVALQLAAGGASSFAVTGSTLALSGTNFNLATSGALTLAGAQAADITTAAGTAPTALVFQPGSNSTATSSGAAFTLQAGNDTGATAATGGLLTLKGGNATTGTTTTGGGVTIDSGSGTTAGGAITIGGTNSASTTIGRAANGITLTLQGGAASTFTGTNATGTTAFGFTAPTTAGISTYQLPAGGTGGTTYQICTTLSVCAGYSGGSGTAIVETPTSTAQNTINPGATAGVVALTVRGGSSGSPDILDVIDSGNTKQDFFSSTGSLNVAQVIQPTTNNAVDLGLSGTTFRTGYFGTSVVSPSFTGVGAVSVTSGGANALTLDTGGAAAINIGAASAAANAINLNQSTTVLGGKNLSLASGAGQFSQTFTGTTTDAHTITANGLTTGTALKVTSSSNTAANTSWSAIQFNPTNAQGTTAVTGANLIAGLDEEFTQAATVAGNNETVANFAIAPNSGSPTDSTVNSIVNLANNDTATGNQITATNGLLINGGNITNGINLNGTFGTSLITSSHFSVSQAGAIVGVGVDAGTGMLQGTGGFTLTGTTQINATTAGTTTIGNGSGGAVAIASGAASTINVGANTLAVTSSNFNVTTGGVGSVTTALQAPLFQTADGAGASANLVLRSGNTTGGSSLSTGTLTIKTGDGTGTNTSSGNIRIDTGAKSGSGFSGNINIGDANALNVNIGHNAATASGTSVSIQGLAATSNLVFNDATNTNQTTITVTTPTANRSITFPDAAGNVCLDTGNCGNSTGYILNQNSVNQTGNFRISGNGQANTSFLTPLLDTPSGTTTLAIGTSNATAGISLNQNTTIATGKSLTVTSGALTQSGGAVSLSGSTTSSLVTTSGALTLTSAAAALWSTGSGDLSLTGAGNLNLGNGGGNAVNIGTNAAGHTIAIGTDNTTTQGVTLGSTASGSTVTVKGGATSATVANAGVTVATTTNSNKALVVQNSEGANSALLLADTTNTNLLTNSSFESSASGWIGRGSGTIASDTTQALYGNASGKVTTTATSNDGAKYNFTMTNTQVYGLSFWAMTTGSSFTVRFGRSDAGTTGGETQCGTGTVSGTWTRFTCTFTAGAQSGTPYIFITQNDSTARSFFIDGVQLELTAVTAYHEGNIQLNGAITAPTTFKNASNTVSALDVQNASGTSQLTVDTVDSQVNIGGTLQVNTITPTGTLQIGASAQTLTLLGGASTSLAVTSGANTLTVNFAAPTVNGASYTFAAPTTASANYTICTTDSASCGGASGGLGYIAKGIIQTDNVTVSGVNTTLLTLNNTGGGSTSSLAVNNGSGQNSALSVTSSSSINSSNALIFGNDTSNGATGNLLDLWSTQSSTSASRFAVDMSGNVVQNGGSSTADTVNSQRISAAANFTGTVATGNTLTVSAGGIAVTGASTITGTLGVSSTLSATGSGAAELIVSGTPLQSATTALAEIGNAAGLGGLNNVTNGGTYLALNVPSSGAGSAADMLNFENNGSSKFLIDKLGNITTVAGQTYNTDVLASTGLTFGGAAATTVQSASGQQLNFTSNGNSLYQTTAGNITVDAAGTLSLGTVNSTSVLIGKTTTTTQVNGGFTEGAAGSTQFTNNSSTLNTALALGDLASGNMGSSAGATVDVYTAFTISPTASGRSYTIFSPSNAAAGRVIYVSNINATNSFTLVGSSSVLINAGVTATLVWNGSAWTFAGTDASGLQSAYNNSGTTNPQIQLSNTNGGVKIDDAASSTIGNLFSVNNNGHTVSYFAVTSAAATVTGNIVMAATSAGGGTRSLTVANQTTGGQTGDALSVIAAAGNTTGLGGQLNLTAGAGGNAAAGGQVVITGGAAGGGNNNGGAASLQGGAATGTGTGGALTLAGGAPAATAGSQGGAVTINGGAGTGTGTGAAGNAVNINGGAAGGTGNNAGGGVTITGGAATGTGAGGLLTLQGGAASATAGSTGGALSVLSAAGAASASATTAGNGGALTITSGSGGNNSSTGVGGNGSDITITAGSGGTGGATANNSNGGSIHLTAGNASSSGSGTIGVPGVVFIDSPVFTSTTESTSSGSFAVPQGDIDGFGTVVITDTAVGGTVTVSAPRNTATGHILYIVASNGSNAFTLSPSGGPTVNMNPDDTEMLVWNGSQWTASVSGSSLQQVYNNTSTSPASIVTTSSTKNILLQAGSGDDNANLFQIGNSLGAQELTVDTTNTATGSNLAINPGGETQGSPPTGWAAHGAATITSTTTAGQFASGLAAVQAATTAAATTGVRNNVGTAMVASTTYNISFSVKVSSWTALTNSNLSVVFSPTGTTSNNATCSTFTAASNPAINTSTFIKYACIITTTATATTSSAYLAIFQNDTTARNIWIDNLAIVLQNSTGAQNTGDITVGGSNGQGLTLLTLDSYAGTPFTGTSNTNLLGSMYYDTTAGRIECYESDGWGSCSPSPTNTVVLTPEYAGAVLNGTGTNNTGIMTANLCANQGSLTINTAICASTEKFSYYQWTSTQAVAQTYDIFERYALPSTFKSFSGNITATARTDNTTNGVVDAFLYDGSGTACGNTSTSVVNTWQVLTIAQGSCVFNPGDIITFKIDTSSKSSANVYASNLTFTMTGK